MAHVAGEARVPAACALACFCLSACFSADLGNGAIRCGNAGLCPPSYYCHHDGRCWKTAEVTGSVSDLSSSAHDLAVAKDHDLSMVSVPDLASTDIAQCSPAICQPGQCGKIPDPCSGYIDCGMNCPTGETCAGGGMNNVCGCPTEQYCNGRDCGTIPNGCGGIALCGTTCPTGKTCGAGNHANLCGTGGMCNPKMCAPNHDCGLVSDGCSAVLTCPPCANGHACVNNVCQ
jgi:hypothetical protein